MRFRVARQYVGASPHSGGSKLPMVLENTVNLEMNSNVGLNLCKLSSLRPLENSTIIAHFFKEEFDR